MASLKLGCKTLDSSDKEIYIIAEIGQNHQGSVDIAKELIRNAKLSGCDCVKFQKSDLSAKFTQSALKRQYEGKMSWGKTYGEHKKHLEFSIEQYTELQRYSHEIGIDFSASAMDENSLNILNSLHLPFIKIGSGDANNFPLLEKASKMIEPLVISTGMQTMATIHEIVTIMRKANKRNYALMHCVSSYPTRESDCNLRLIALLQSEFPDVIIGYSGHETGVNISKAAVLLGAKIIERHFTLDRNQKGSDHLCSLEPKEMKDLVNCIQLLQKMDFHNKAHSDTDSILRILGKTVESIVLDKKAVASALKPIISKKILDCELNCKHKLGKSIVAATDLIMGTIIDRRHINIKVSEPQGLPAEEFYNIIGSKVVKSVQADDPIKEENIQK